MAAAEAKVCGEELRRLREAAGQEGAAAGLGASDILAALERLSALQLDLALLRETGIGREVNDKFLRAHADAAVRDRSRALVHSWKSLVQPKAEPPAGAGSGAAVQAEAPAAAPAAEAAAPDGGAAADGAASARPQKKRAAASQDEAPRKAKAAKAAPAPAADGPNAALAALFSELAGFEFKRKEKFKGVAYKKVAAALLAHDEEITGGPQAAALPGIGKQSATKIQEYVDTGKIERLERYRNGDLEE
ncbi:unnamed protein product [Prorocentrum cordatum]|uniref:TFIIS N-terminal domain-containing protein n=1 Tax=Prorocentrum cordatum TaxID=2364126 RepID=A0ABN9UY52_9DINO|nr:unnamed protein product [Polarella glacialis]